MKKENIKKCICEICGKKFKTEGTLKRHGRDVHNKRTCSISPMKKKKVVENIPVTV